MILIDIRKSNKLKDSEYSAFIKFDYNSKIVDAIRELPFRYYNPSETEWEVPTNKVEYLINKLKEFDIKICGKITIFEDKNTNIGLPEGFEFKTKPFSHQLEGVEYGLKYDRWFLGDEQGCISGESFVKIKEIGKSANRDIKIKNLKKAFDLDKTIKIKSLVNGRFAYMPIKAVVNKGFQKTLELNLEDTSIQCTPDHLIYTENGWVEADKIKVGDKVFTNGIQTCPLCGTTENLITYKYSKFFGYCKSCMYKSRNGTKYNEIIKKIDDSGYVRLFGKETRDMPNYDKMCGMGIYEHHQVWYKNTGHIVDTSKEVVHHKNGIKTDNRFENLQLLTISEHDRLHSDTKTSHLYQFNENLDYIDRKGKRIYLKPRLQEVTSKTYLGKQQVWDIAIDDDNIHNFICNNIVVHNCGKTKQIIDIAVARKVMYGYRFCLIVCGVNTLKWNWVNEIHTHSKEDAYILGQRRKGTKIRIGSTKDKLEDLKLMYDIKEPHPYFIITNVESFRDKNIADTISDLCKKGIIGMCAADEMHKMKNPTAQQTKGFLKCLPDCRIGMTGTPLMNSPMDLYVILKWLGYESHAFYSFKQHYCVMGGYGGYEIVGYKNLDQLTAQVREIMLRRLKSEVLDLPEKIYVDDVVEMDGKQAVMYKEVEAGLKADYINGDIDLTNPLSALIRLRQTTGYPGILSETITESAKLDRMEELVENCTSNDEKVLIFSNWTQMTDAICNKLKSEGHKVGVITGETPDNLRQEIVDVFQNSSDLSVLVGTIGAMGTGLTLTAATTVIFLDEPWNKALFDQAVDRAHRIGQKNNITIYSIMCKDTIDERIHNLIYKKGAMSDAIIDGKVVGNKNEVFDYLLNG